MFYFYFRSRCWQVKSWKLSIKTKKNKKDSEDICPFFFYFKFLIFFFASINNFQYFFNILNTSKYLFWILYLLNCHFENGASFSNVAFALDEFWLEIFLQFFEQRFRSSLKFFANKETRLTLKKKKKTTTTILSYAFLSLSCWRWEARS